MNVFSTQFGFGTIHMNGETSGAIRIAQEKVKKITEPRLLLIAAAPDGCRRSKKIMR